MADRWRLHQYRSLLDLGCGKCHWSRLLAPRMTKGAQITAYDRDPKWAAGDEQIRSEFSAYGAKVEFRQGDAHRLPFADNQFDVATCQTVLMHVADPLAVLMEMRRVVRPGGIIICVEPCNLIQTGISNSISAEMSIDELCDAYRYALLCERGKRAAGEGSLSLGDRLPHLFQQAGLVGAQTYLSDRAAPINPAYATLDEQVNLAELLSTHTPPRQQIWQTQVNGWVDALHDASAQAFVAHYHSQNLQRLNRLQQQIDTGEYWSPGAALSYLVSAIK